MALSRLRLEPLAIDRIASEGANVLEQHVSTVASVSAILELSVNTV
jgi:hypothetical protein